MAGDVGPSVSYSDGWPERQGLHRRRQGGAGAAGGPVRRADARAALRHFANPKGSGVMDFAEFFSASCLSLWDVAAVGALLSQVLVGTGFLLFQGPRACLPKALGYLAIGALNLAAVALPPAPARARWRSAAAAAFRAAYLLPALLLMDTCRLGPGAAAVPGGGPGDADATGVADQPWRGLLKLLVYDTGAVFALWYGVMLPLPFRLHVAVQTASWLAVASRLGRRVCSGYLRPCEAPAFVQLHAGLRALVEAPTHTSTFPPPPAAADADAAAAAALLPGSIGQCPAGGGAGCAISAATAAAAAAGCAEGVPGAGARAACHAVVQLTVFYVGWVAPLLCGAAFERILRRRWDEAEEAAAARGSASEGPSAAARGASRQPPPLGQRRQELPGRPAGRLSAAALLFYGLALLLASWVAANALAPHL